MLFAFGADARRCTEQRADLAREDRVALSS
jgi:hypothetical protein